MMHLTTTKKVQSLCTSEKANRVNTECAFKKSTQKKNIIGQVVELNINKNCETSN